jgi:ankyrin repeat protein
MRMKVFVGVAILVSAATVAGAASSPIADAVKEGNRAAVRALIARKADVNAPEGDGTTALHWAVRADDMETAQLLVRAGANVKAANRYSVTPLSLAATNGNAAMIEMLVKAGADPNSVYGEGETVLMAAAKTGNPEAVKALAAHGADINAKEAWYGQSALMWAAAENSAAAVKVLVELGADINAKSNVVEPKGRGGLTTVPKGGFTSVMFAARQGSVEAIRTLADAGADVNAVDPDGISALEIALLSGHYDAAGALIQKGADVNLADKTGRAPLYVAVDMHSLEWRFNRPAPKLFDKTLDPVAVTKMLLARGADVNAELKANILAPKYNATGNRNLSKGTTPFLKAASTSDMEMMRLLLDWGADPWVTNQLHTNAIMVAAGLNWGVLSSLGTQEEAIDAITILLGYGLDINAANDLGQTALHAAAARTDEKDANKLIQFLVDHGANLYARTRPGAPVGRGAAPAPAAGGTGQTALEVARGGAGDLDAMGNPSTRPENKRTVALLQELMRTHPEK